MPLILAPHFDAPDDFYEALINAHRDLSADDSHALNARLVLLLANHIGDLAVLREALHLARESRPDAGSASGPACGSDPGTAMA